MIGGNSDFEETHTVGTAQLISSLFRYGTNQLKVLWCFDRPIPEELNREVLTVFSFLQSVRLVFSTINLGIRLASDPALRE